MLRSDLIELRARSEDDVPILHSELYEDVATSVRADTRPWRPLPPSAGPYVVGQEADNTSAFSIVERASATLAGEASIWGMDTFHRTGHVGIALRPSFRGRGLATDTLRVLVRYGFAIRGLHRLQLETLADNVAMRRAAERCGFVLEGTLRRSSWVDGAFVDELIFGLLADDQSPTPG
jgi:RimJ/RimL family protein N-acetyltransferase